MNRSQPSQSAGTQTLSRPKLLVFSLVTSLVALTLINAVISTLERRAHIRTLTPTEGIQFVDRPILRREGSDWVTSDYGNRSLERGRFPAGDAPGWRAFLHGGSFMMGDPYSKPGFVPDHHKSEGAIASWLRVDLAALGATEPVEVLNFAAPAQNSERVKQIAHITLDHDPDVLIVATGNNEGSISPHPVKIALRKFAGFRFLWQLLQPPPPPDAPYYTPQLGEPAPLLAQYEANLTALIERAGKRDTPVLLCRMPINLRNRWQSKRFADFVSDPTPHTGPHDPHWVELVRPMPPTEDERTYTSGMKPAQEIEPGNRSAHTTVRGIRLLRAGRIEQGRESLAAFHAPCAADGVLQWLAGDWSAATATLGDCDTVGDALLWIGGALFERGNFEQAEAVWMTHAERHTGGRTRPSYNDVVKRLAAAHEHVSIADLHTAAKRLSPHGIPGPEIYRDACHMNWRGYAGMSAAIAQALVEAGLAPKGCRFDPTALPNRDVTRREWGLEDLP